MSIIHVTGSGKSLASERTLFTGPTVPNEIKKMIKPLKKVDQSALRTLLQVVVKALEGKELPEYIFDGLTSEKVTEEDLAFVYSGLWKLLKLALRIPVSSLKQETFVEDLRELKIPEDFIADISSVVYGSRRSFIDTKVAENTPHLPHLDSFRWRVDVSISTSSLNRALQPSILVDMAKSDGTTHQFEMDISKFHELRYNISRLLKQMEDLEKRSILKIEEKS